ncbi:endolytic transglycosylase MltG [Calderihabitans maritimus]|uniref:Putative periplasmic solute-binding protein n=1 Tax=Calderihabitans maritimus TaxID=1246530 RepID=A0A1Z5HTU1_9FIRM|nr:endolytic transglycosylase MltG [Calderihabitans maritimus]GAW92942.1 putative periplasmic solute-binding protein [Calderihabitans maritimus]
MSWIKQLAPVIFGLGIGLCLSALFFLGVEAAPPDRQQVIQLAREYGMVFPEEVVVFEEKGREEEKGEEIPPLPQEIEVTIPKGSTLKEISLLLASKGVVDKAEKFEELVKLLHLSHKIRAGDYRLPADGDLYDIILELTAPTRRD